MANQTSCHICRSENTYLFFHLPAVPTQDGVMGSTESAALEVPQGEIKLQFCKNCGFIQNNGYDSEKISFDNYDFSNDHSPLFRKFVDEISARLIAKYDLRHQLIIDVGAGDGDFLKALCLKGPNKGIGVDPGFDHTRRKDQSGGNVSFIREYYSAKHRDLAPDLVVSRHVINLLGDPIGFLKIIRDNLEGHHNSLVYLEVPNAEYTFGNNVIWNVAYEHGCWFTKETLSLLFEKCDFEVLHVETCWNDEFIGIEARPCPKKTFRFDQEKMKVDLIENTIRQFRDSFQTMMSTQEERIKKYQEANSRVIAWGAGARAVTCFNLFNLRHMVPFIIDINKNRHDKYLPGSGQKIVAPDFIREYQPDVVMITNPTYASEIQDQISSYSLQPEIWIL